MLFYQEYQLLLDCTTMLYHVCPLSYRLMKSLYMFKLDHLLYYNSIQFVLLFSITLLQLLVWNVVQKIQRSQSNTNISTSLSSDLVTSLNLIVIQQYLHLSTLVFQVRLLNQSHSFLQQTFCLVLEGPSLLLSFNYNIKL